MEVVLRNHEKAMVLHTHVLERHTLDKRCMGLAEEEGPANKDHMQEPDHTKTKEAVHKKKIEEVRRMVNMKPADGHIGFG